TLTMSGNSVAPATQNGAWQIIRTLPLSGNGTARFIAINTGKAYVTRSGGQSAQSISAVDLTSGSTVGDIPINFSSGADPGAIAAIENKAYVSLRNLGNNGQLAVVNTDNNSLITYVPVGTDPFGVAASGSSVYVSNFSNSNPSTVKVLDRSTN